MGPKNVSQISRQTQLGQPILADFASSKIRGFFFSPRISMKLGMHLGVIKYIDGYLIHLFDASHTERATRPKGQNAQKVSYFWTNQLRLSALRDFFLGSFRKPTLWLLFAAPTRVGAVVTQKLAWFLCTIEGWVFNTAPTWKLAV